MLNLKIPRIGKRFGLWRFLGQCRIDHSDRHHRRFWRCRCRCGTVRYVLNNNLLRGRSTSCGCRRTETIVGMFTRHGHARAKRLSPTYSSWSAMKARCTRKTGRFWKYYGAKGIKVCRRWARFEAFLSDMGPRPKGTTLDRINGKKNYMPSNCRWATWIEQNEAFRKNH